MQSTYRSNAPISQHFPRQVYAGIVGLGIWLAISIWGFCGRGFVALILGFIGLAIALVVAAVMLAAFFARRRGQPREEPQAGSFAEWLGQEFESHTGRMSASAAAIQLLLPLAAVAFGMSLFAVVHHLDVIGA
jgi:hypothetical protein